MDTDTHVTARVLVLVTPQLASHADHGPATMNAAVDTQLVAGVPEYPAAHMHTAAVELPPIHTLCALVQAFAHASVAVTSHAAPRWRSSHRHTDCEHTPFPLHVTPAALAGQGRADTDAERVMVTLGVSDVEEENDSEGDEDRDNDAVVEAVMDMEFESDMLPDNDVLDVSERDGVRETLMVAEKDDEALSEGDADALIDVDAVKLIVGDTEGVDVAEAPMLGVTELLTEMETLLEGDADIMDCLTQKTMV